MAETDHVQQFLGPGAMLAAAAQKRPDALGDHQRREHVFQRGQLGQEVIELEDHAEMAVPQGVAAGGGEIVDPPAAVMDFALVGRIEGTQQVQQGALAGAALADDGQELPLPHAEAHAAQHGHLDRSLAVALVQVDGAELVGLARSARDSGDARRRSDAAGRLNARDR